LEELKNICKNPAIDNRTIKIRLTLKYCNKIIITEKPGRLTFNCFIDNQHDIQSTAWYENKKENEKEERFRILKAAAEIIREDIQCTVFDNSNTLPLIECLIVYNIQRRKCSIPVDRTIVYREACPRGELVLETQEWTFAEVYILFYSQSIIY
jgi:hypothetical protein